MGEAWIGIVGLVIGAALNEVGHRLRDERAQKHARELAAEADQRERAKVATDRQHERERAHEARKLAQQEAQRDLAKAMLSDLLEVSRWIAEPEGEQRDEDAESIDTRLGDLRARLEQFHDPDVRLHLAKVIRCLNWSHSRPLGVRTGEPVYGNDVDRASRQVLGAVMRGEPSADPVHLDQYIADCEAFGRMVEDSMYG